MSKTKQTTPNPESGWEIKDRNYFLIGRHKPITYTVTSRHSQKYPCLYFDEKQGVQKAIRYATNQNSPFVEEQKGEVTLEHIIFRDGSLFVPKEKQNLQKLLSLYHPGRDKRFAEHKPVMQAASDLYDLELEIEALNHARVLEIDSAEAVLRVQEGSKVSKMSSKEIRRDVLLLAKHDPKLFIELASDDNVMLRNFGIKAVEAGIINLTSDNRDFKWASNGRKLLTVPFEEHPYSALAAWFKTDEGLDVYKTIEKKIS